MSQNDALKLALQGLLNKYTALVSSGDAGDWNPETDTEVIAARAVLSATQPAQAAQSDGRGTDAQIEKERDIARHAIVGSLAAGYAGQVHPGADHWLAAAHEAGARIKELEDQAAQGAGEVWGWAVVDARGNAQYTRVAKEDRFTENDIKRYESGLPQYAPMRVVTLYTRPTPSPAQAAADARDAVPDAARDVLAERQRQVSIEGWTPKHDDQHQDGSMALAAACYALNAAVWNERGPSIPQSDYTRLANPGFRWPWAMKWWKPKSQRQDLIKAGALILAEIERMDRADLATHQQRQDGGEGRCES